MTNENKINDGGPAYLKIKSKTLEEWIDSLPETAIITKFSNGYLFCKETNEFYFYQDTRESILDEMVKENQEMGLYDEVKDEKATV